MKKGITAETEEEQRDPDLLKNMISVRACGENMYNGLPLAAILLCWRQM
jgi:hypothetical protein